MQKLESGLTNLKRNKMKEYLDTLAVVMMTTLTIGVIVMVVAGSYMVYKFLKDEY
jgi:hypothetical protein